ncbi:aspartyl protease family protein 2-like [Oryza brachyantha]|uniref:aspartyl protease family protein 2-like n=1 Tax=Oryza brachyantha TaxID=4533 RepID=UPI001ADBA895|nr:aspartyl protease family protein 2-like [Oryza brachyantha]
MTGFSVGGERVTGFSNASLALDPATGRGGVVVDSGTAISRFSTDAYAALRDAFDAHAAAAGMRRLAWDYSVFDACYDLRGRPAASAPPILLHFAGGADMALPPENYFLPVNGGKRRPYYRCLGLEAADDGLSVIGNVQQQGFRVVFDVERGRVGFAPNGCSV